MSGFEHLPSRVDAHVLGQWLSPAGVLTAVGSVLGFVPVIVGSIAGLAATCYYIGSTMELPRVRRWLDRRAERRRHRKAARLQYRQAVIVGELKALGLLKHAETVITDKAQVTNIATKAPPDPEMQD